MQTPGAWAAGAGRLAEVLTRANLSLWAFVAYLAASLVLLVYLRSSAIATAEGHMISEARAVARASLQGASPPAGTKSYWLVPRAEEDDFEGAAQSLRSRPPGSDIHELRGVGKQLELRLATVDERHDILVISTTAGSEVLATYRRFQLTYVALTVGGVLIWGCLAFTVIGLRKRPTSADAVTAPLDEAPSVRVRVLSLNALLTAGTCLFIYACDLATSAQFNSAIAYVAVVMISLGAGRALHTRITAAASTVLTVAALMQADWQADMWVVLANRSLAVFVIWSAALLGMWQKHSMQVRRSALEQSRRVSSENSALQAACGEASQPKPICRRTGSCLKLSGGWRASEGGSST